MILLLKCMLENHTFKLNMHPLHERPKIGLFDFELKSMWCISPQVWIIFKSAPKWICLWVLINLVYGNIWHCFISAFAVLFKCGVPIIFKILYSETNFGALEKNQSWSASCVALEKKIHLSFIILYYKTYFGTLVKNKINYDLPLDHSEKRILENSPRLMRCTWGTCET